MTRFARAKGSKSSNERAPEDSTPWEVMKEQLLQAKKDGEESKNREKAEKQRIVNYENFLKEHKTQKRKATWCDFPEAQISILSKPNQASEPAKNRNKKQTTESGQSHSTQGQPPKKKNKKLTTESEQSHSTQGQPLRKENKKLTIESEQSQSTQQQPSEQSHSNQGLSQQEVSNNPQQPKKSKKKKPKNKNASTTNSEAQSNEIKDSGQNNKTKKGRNKNKHNTSAKDSEEQGNEEHTAGQPENKNKKNKKLKVFEEGDTQTAAVNQQNINKTNGNEGQKHKQHKKKKKNLVNGEPARRKPVNEHSFQLIINGKEIELVRYDGFPIMKKDAERLAELKTSMIKKGIPKSEVQRTMKLERRRAEKALARSKRDVCYNCRKGGHNLSDCPELKTKIPGVGAPDGLCFKCGSTEHRQFECKVQDKREDSSIKLQTLDSAELEGIQQKTKSTAVFWSFKEIVLMSFDAIIAKITKDELVPINKPTLLDTLALFHGPAGDQARDAFRAVRVLARQDAGGFGQAPYRLLQPGLQRVQRDQTARALAPRQEHERRVELVHHHT
ncbi:putative zinc finger protein [Operophtera brumata]|uniref:Putative zinc finger protein n=1 Tax=Operophtera brumata TaxID=104452 RepID=A0A0L7LKS6_OPEBR|nr:putative zinc finger protein [Operophtera brumata]